MIHSKVTVNKLFSKIIYDMRFGEVTNDLNSNVQNFEKEFLKTITLPGDTSNYIMVLTDSCTNAIETCIAFCKYHNILPPKNTYKIPDNVYHSVWCAIKKGDPSAKIKLTNEQFYTRYSPFHIINDHSLEQYSERYNIKEALSESTFVCLSFGRGKIYENLNFGRGGAIIFKKGSLFDTFGLQDSYVYSWLKRYNHNGRDSNINVNFDYFAILTAEIKRSKCIFGIPIWTTTEKVILGNKQNHIHELVEGPLKIVREMNQNKESYFNKVLQTEPNTTRYPAISDILKYQ